MKISIIALTLMSGCATVQAEEKQFSYKGFVIGSSANEFQQKLPDWQCRSTSCFYSSEECSNMHGFRNINEFEKKLKECSTNNSFGGAVVGGGYAYMSNGRILKISLKIDRSWTSNLIESISQAYGQPSTNKDEIYQNKFGAKQSGKIVEWKAANSTLRLNEIGSNDKTLEIVLIDSEQEQKEAKEKKDKVDHGSKDF
jgi:hypothetical protein